MRAILMIGLVAVLSTSAFARSPNADGSRKTNDPNRVICKTEDVIGSRLATKKTCMTSLQWDQYNREQRETVDRVQAMKPHNGG